LSVRHFKIPALGKRIFGLSLAAAALLYAYYYLDDIVLLPGLKTFLPKPHVIMWAWLAISSSFVLYHYKRDLVSRVFRAAIILAVFIAISEVGTHTLPDLIDHGRLTWNSSKMTQAEYKQEFKKPSRSVLASGAAILWALLCFGAGIGGAIQLIRGEKKSLQGAEFHRRGRGLISFDEAKSIAHAKKRVEDPGILFGLLDLPSKIATTHFLVAGATGSGKTLTLRLLMQSVLRHIGEGRDTRALIYDAKQDMFSILHGMGLASKIVTLNPFDERCAAWNMAKDITSPATAQQIATILIPEEKHSSNPYFSDAARALLTGVFISFIKAAPGAWTFRDVVYAMKSSSRLRGILERYPETKDLIEQYFSNEKTSNDVISTVATKMQRYEYIAAAWDRATTQISLRDWLTDEYILVLGNDEATRTALDAINQVIFKRLTELVLAQSESDTRRTWVFLDELRQAGKLDGMNSLLTMGRSKGACAVLGFQDIEGLSSVYGDREAAELVGLCANKAILRTDSPGTAKWASSLFGEREILEYRRSKNEGSGSSSSTFKIGDTHSSQTSESLSEQVAKREVLLPSEIMDMATTSLDTSLPGYYIIPEIGAYGVRISGPWIKSELRQANADVPNIIKRPEEHQYLRAWDYNDLLRLGISRTPKSAGNGSEDDEHALIPAPAQSPSLLDQIKR